MNKLDKLRARLNELSAEANDLIEKDEITEEDETRMSEIEAEMKKVRGQIEAVTQLQNSVSFAEGLEIQGTGRQSTPRVSNGEPAFMSDGNWGFEDLGEFAVASMRHGKGIVSDKLQTVFNAAPTNYHRLIASDDGLMAPPQMVDELYENVNEVADLHTRADVEPTNANSVKLLADESTPWGSSGVKSYYIAEAGQMTASRLVTEGRQVDLHKQYTYVLATEELREDASRLSARLTKRSAQAMAWTRSEAIMRGTGVGEPLGILNSDCLITVAKESGQAAGSVTLQNFLDMYERMNDEDEAGEYIWLMNRSLFKSAAQLTLGQEPIWMPPGYLAGSPNGSILGLPIVYSRHCSAAGSVGDIVLAKMKGYFHPARSNGPNFASSMHLYFDYDVHAFRWTHRNGGMCYLNSAVSPADGGSRTTSDFITLAARA